MSATFSGLTVLAYNHLPPFSQLESLRNHAVVIKKSVDLQHSPSQLWPYLSNTDMLNKRIALAPTNPIFMAMPKGGSFMQVESREAGLKMNYYEWPFEWNAPHHLHVERMFKQGPLQYLRFSIDLKPTPNGCIATVALTVVSRLPLMFVKFRLQSIVKKMGQLFIQIDKNLNPQAHLAVAAFMEPVTHHQPAINRLAQRWQSLSPDSKIPRAVAEFIYTAPDRYVNKMRPFELARLYHLDPMATLQFFLLATKKGFLNLSWDLLCTSCQGAQERTATLLEVNPQVHCDVCAIDYHVRLDENVELTFYPVKNVREVSEILFCAGSPANSSQLMAQINVWPEQPTKFTLKLPLGDYQLRSLSLAGGTPLKVSAAGLAQVDLTLTESLFPTELHVAPECEFRISNPLSSVVTLKLENMAWREERVTAALVSTLQDFRDLFGSEVLRPGVNLDVANVVIMFTDLKDSTRMYEIHGDAPAFNLVQDHFEIMREVIRKYEGAVVKTIGDAVMAVFHDPVQALQAALAIQVAFARWNQTRPQEMQAIVKIGLHSGPCIALNLNDRLDYFGSTVNKAARVQGESLGLDVVLSADLWLSELLATHRHQPDYKIETFERQLRGLAETATLYRLMPIET